MKVAALFLSLSVAAAIIVWLVLDWQVLTVTEPAAIESQQTAIPAPAENGNDSGRIDSESTAPSVLRSQLQGPTPLAVQSPVLQDYPAEFSPLQWFELQFEEMASALPEEIPERRKDALSGNADSAFWMYMYFDHCGSQPRAAWQLERALDEARNQLDRAIQEHYDNIDEWYTQHLKLEQGFKLCAILGTDFDTVSAALEWLEIAADLGHLPAQSLYFEWAWYLISLGNAALAFKHPGLVEEFKIRADTYVKALLHAKHPHALILMSQMLWMGGIYERDLLKAYAYARAAERFNSEETQQQAQAMQRLIESELPPAELNKANKLARELLLKYKIRVKSGKN